MTSNSFQRVAVLAVVVMLALTAFAPAPGAATSDHIEVDTETSNTATTTDWQDGDNVTGYNGTADARSANVSLESDSNNTKIDITRENSSAVVFADSDGTNFAHHPGTANHEWLNHTVPYAALGDMERGINDNVSVTVTAYNNTSMAAGDRNTTNFTVFIETDNSSTVQHVSDSDVASENIVTVTNDTGRDIAGFTIPTTPEQESHIHTNARAVNGSSTDVVLALGNASVADHFSVADKSSGDKLSGFSLTRTVALVHDADGDTTRAVPVFYEQAPSDFDTSQTYAVYTETHGGTPAVVVNLGDDFSDASNVEVEAVGDAGLLTFATDYLGQTLSMSLSGSGLTLSILAFAGAPTARRRREPAAVPAEV